MLSRHRGWWPKKQPRRGWPVRVNDHLYCSMVMAAARLTARPAVPFTAFGGYKAAVAILDRVKPREGFIWREYTPASVRFAGVQRQYFTEMNGARIDGLRATIADWRAIGQIGETEERLLIADLLAAVNRVANIAGTYGCFLSTWAPNARQPLELRPRPLITETVPIEAFNRDVLDVPAAMTTLPTSTRLTQSGSTPPTTSWKPCLSATSQT